MPKSKQTNFDHLIDAHLILAISMYERSERRLRQAAVDLAEAKSSINEAIESSIERSLGSCEATDEYVEADHELNAWAAWRIGHPI